MNFPPALGLLAFVVGVTLWFGLEIFKAHQQKAVVEKFLNVVESTEFQFRATSEPNRLEGSLDDTHVTLLQDRSGSTRRILIRNDAGQRLGIFILDMEFSALISTKKEASSQKVTNIEVLKKVAQLMVKGDIKKTDYYFAQPIF